MESYALVPTNPSLVDEHSDTTLPPTASLNLNELATEAEITTLIQASGNITLVLKSLHWLIVPRRVYYILPNTHNALKPLHFLTFVNHSPSTARAYSLITIHVAFSISDSLISQILRFHSPKLRSIHD